MSMGESRAGSLALGIAFAAAAMAQEPVPSFPGRAEALTVDVVVLDKGGRPVRGLTKADFTLLEDGKPQEIVGFEVRDLAVPGPGEAAAEVVAGLPRADDEAATGGRRLAFIIDDLGMDARGVAALESIREWVRTRADPRDELSLITTSGSVDWSGPVGSGRADALRALVQIRGRRPPPSFFEMTEWQAYMYVSGRPEGKLLKGGNEPQGAGYTPRPMGLDPLAPGGGGKAYEIYNWWRQRADAVVSAIGTFSREHAAERGRKSLFVFSQTFIRDDDLKQTDDAIDAARRGNAAIYFVDTRGLVAGDMAEVNMFGDSVREASARVDTGGAEHIALATGGDTIRDTNDILGRLARAVDESSVYYLLGYQPTKDPDGQWHKLEVKLAREGLKLRARRGYYASARPLAEQALEAARKTKDSEPIPEASPAGDTAQPAPTSTPARPSKDAPSGASDGKVPVFESRAEAITVDVVVLDKAGRVVTDLGQSDFTLLEDGRPQSIVGFESRSLADAVEDAEVPDEDVASNEKPRAKSGRTLAFLVDDLGIEPLRMTETGKALAHWLGESADPRDEVTIVTTSGEAWWSARVGEGRADLGAVLQRLKGRKRAASSSDAMSDFEAYNIDTNSSPMEGAGSGEASGPPSAGGGCTTNAPTTSPLDRVMDRWFRTSACLCEPSSPGSSIRACRSQIMARSREVYRAATLRAIGLLGAVERVSLGLAAARGRKSLVVLSEGLLRDTDQKAFERAVDASRRGNTSVSFVDVRGLIGLSFFGAEQTAPTKPGDMGTLTMEATVLETAGGEYLAETTGGTTVRNTNDIAGSVGRLADEASAYYLLGYQTDRPLDGKWHKLEVKVGRPGVKVRARRGFFATKASPPLELQKAAKKKKDKKTKGKGEELPVRLLDPALAVGGAQDGVPLRMAAHVFEMDASRTARVLVVVEVGTTSLTLGGTGPLRKAQLDVTVLGVSRDQAQTIPLDSHVELDVDPKVTDGWWTFSRELRLPPGAAQVRTLVRDTASGRTGLVAQRLEVPSPDAPYLSTPLLTNRLRSKAAVAPGAPRIVPIAHRRFPARGELYCAYEVYVAPGSDPKVIPRIEGGYTLQDDRGRTVSSAPPTPIAIALGAQIVRLFSVPLTGLAPGRYELTIRTVDRDRGVNLEAKEAFVVEPPDPGAPIANAR